MLSKKIKLLVFVTLYALGRWGAGYSRDKHPVVLYFL